MADPDTVTASDVISVVGDILLTGGYVATSTGRSHGRAAALLGSFTYVGRQPADAVVGTAELERAIMLLLPMLRNAQFDVQMMPTSDVIDIAECERLMTRAETIGTIVELLCDLRDANRALGEGGDRT